MNENPNQTTEQISWQAPEFTAHQKTLQWYVTFGVISLLLLAFAVFTGSFITITTFILGIAIAYFFATKQPQNTTYTMSGLGIGINHNTIPYKNIRKFWIIYKPPQTKTLNFETTAYLNNTVSLELGDQDPVAVKLFLKRYLPEDLDMDETITDILARKAKF
ncbi:MAG: hypothetical protein HY395_02880 [Candidatus Doudnabacteria bacterium]|nr:hypothetical protein [Candidatus Doudnabacteria bacterium]